MEALDIEGAVIHGTEKAGMGILQDVVEYIVITEIFEEALQDVINEHTRLIYYDVTAIKVILVLQSVLIFTYFFYYLRMGVENILFLVRLSFPIFIFVDGNQIYF